VHEQSSRSHAVVCVLLRDGRGTERGRLQFCDLAGSEKAQDAQGLSAKVRHEGAEINKSLLALKECLRAANGETTERVPWRNSQLTQILRDSFSSGEACMVSAVAPSNCSCAESLNTMHYASRCARVD